MCGMAQAVNSRVPADPPSRRLVIVLTIFAGISALGGAIELFVGRTGNQYVPLSLIDNTPFETFLVPSLLLGIVVGGTSLASAFLVWRRSPAAPDVTAIAGGALTLWIVAEVAIMRHVHWLHALYGGLGAAILAQGVKAALRSGVPRRRWLLVVTVAEAVGYMVPACTGVLSVRAGLDGPAQAVLLGAAGLGEGFALGLGQALAFPFPVRKMRFALLTALGASAVWSAVMLLLSLARSQSVSGAFMSIAGVGAALLGLLAMGGVQWLELRHHATAGGTWIAWTALAWTLALPFSFAPSAFVDESTPIAAHLVLWGCGGLLMAFVMAQTTWEGVRRLGASRGAVPPRQRPE